MERRGEGRGEGGWVVVQVEFNGQRMSAGSQQGMGDVMGQGRGERWS